MSYTWGKLPSCRLGLHHRRENTKQGGTTASHESRLCPEPPEFARQCRQFGMSAENRLLEIVF
jgi:hypothetical protein